MSLLKDISLESKILQDLSLGRLKCSNIVKDVLAKREKEKLIENLKTCKFFILINESILQIRNLYACSYDMFPLMIRK